MNKDVLICNYFQNYANEVIDLWNSEVGFIFKLDSNVFSQKVDESKYLFSEGSFVAKVDNKIVGVVITKLYDGDEIIKKYINKGWISFMYVSRNYRRQGIGNNLLEKCEEKLFEHGVTSISIGSDMDNFFPGIPCDFDNLSDVFFRNRGYKVSYYTHDLVCKLDERISSISLSNNIIDNKEVNYHYATIDDKNKVLDFMRNNFYGRWYYECLQYFEEEDIKKEYLIAVYDGNVIGFLRVNNQLIRRISYNITWKNNFKKLVGFGPLGVDSNFRHHGIASDLIKYALLEAHTEGYSEALIDWTGLMSYYQKFGFEVWKCYAYAQKDVNVLNN